MSIVITGNPGVGKHTIAKSIAREFGLSIIDINAIAKDEGLFEKIDETNDVDTTKLGKILKGKISEKHLVVGHLAPYVLEKKQVKKIIILRRDPYELVTVYRERKYTDNKIKENIGSEILGIIAHDTKTKFEEKSFQINTSSKSIQEIVEKITIIISKNKGNDEVDWLDLVTKNNDLKKFFGD